jgi:WhiB family redox-sensing transcriptional regulator
VDSDTGVHTHDGPPLVGRYIRGCRHPDCCALATAAQKERRDRFRNLERDAVQFPDGGPFTPAPWMAEANCLGMGVDLFFPERGGCGAGETANAKDVCRGCVVRVECLEAGMDEKFGMWGGMTPRERRRLRMKRTVA